MRLIGTRLLLFTCLAATSAWAQASDPLASARCANRLSIAFLGTSPTPTLLQSTNPQGQVDQLMQDPKFQDRFATFINATFNDMPAPVPEADAAYYLSKYVLVNNLPWSQLFIGPFRVDKDPANNNVPTVFSDPNGLGYFRSMPWEINYAGNEQAGYKLRTAYRMMNNVIGLHLIPATNAPGADISATGRQAPQCAGCHYNPTFGLDPTTRILTLRVGTGNNITFAPPDPAMVPQTLLGGIVVHDDGEFIHALVNSTSYQYRACRLAFMYLYGRPEYTCEGPIFDKCMAAFNTDGMIQSALKAVASDATFCQ